VKLNDILTNVDEKWRPDFLRFIDTGEANDDFLNYLNHDKSGQQAVELAFDAHAQSFRGLADELKSPPPAEEIVMDPAAVASKKLVYAVEGVLELAPDQRSKVVKQAASKLLTATPGRRHDVVEAAETVASVFKERLGEVAAKE
jgi:hypothetical protein